MTCTVPTCARCTAGLRAKIELLRIGTLKLLCPEAVRQVGFGDRSRGVVTDSPNTVLPCFIAGHHTSSFPHCQHSKPGTVSCGGSARSGVTLAGTARMSGVLCRLWWTGPRWQNFSTGPSTSCRSIKASHQCSRLMRGSCYISTHAYFSRCIQPQSARRRLRVGDVSNAFIRIVQWSGQSSAFGVVSNWKSSRVSTSLYTNSYLLIAAFRRAQLVNELFVFPCRFHFSGQVL